MNRYRPRVLRHEPRTVVITVRQAECLDGLVDGLMANQIARELGASHASIRRSLHRLYQNLGANDRAHAVGLVLTGRVTVLVRDPNGERRAA